MRLLFLSRWFPYPADNGSRLRVFHLLRSLAVAYEVHLVSFTSEMVSSDRLDAMRAYCQTVETVPYQPFRPGSLRALAGFLSLRPRSVEDTFSLEMQSRVREVNRAAPCDVVIVSQIDMAPYAVRLPISVKVLEELEIATLSEQVARASGGFRRVRAQLMWWKYAQYVRQVLESFSGCTVVSEDERKRVQALAPAGRPVIIVPNGADVAGLSGDFGAPEADSLVYSGALTYQANFDAMDYFLREIFPHIRVIRPKTKLMITGKLDGVPVGRLPQLPGVVFTGYLPDVRPTVARSWASVVPLRLGGGTRLKILEAMALGTPVVATRKGVEGLDLSPERDFLLADTPADFAAQTLRLLAEPGLRQALSRQARQTVEAHYDWATIGRTLAGVLGQLAGAAGNIA